VGTSILFWLVVGVRRRPWPSVSVVAAGLALGIFQVGANYSVFEGFARAPASLIVLLFYIYLLIVAVGAACLYGEAFGLRQILALALGLSGIGLTVGTPSSTPTIGVVLGLTSGVCTAAYILGARGLMRGSLEAMELVALMFAGPAVGFAIAAGVRGLEIPSAQAAGYATGLVVVGTFLAMIFFYTAVKLVGAATASLLATVEPLVAVVLAYVVLDESLEPGQLVGGALILGGVAALMLPVRIRGRRPEPAAHT
jgi:drug/metabolite transporter (DMT)-like permease